MLEWTGDFLWLIVKFVLPILIGCLSLYYLVLYPNKEGKKTTKIKYSDSIFTVPNIITLIGIALIPLGLYYYYVGSYLLSFSCFFLSGFSDLLDGYAASRLNQRTELGEIIDPLRDRLLLLAGLWIFIQMVDINGIALCLLLSPLIMGEAGIVYLGYKNPEIQVHSVGKARQAVHLFFIFLLFLNKFDLVFWEYLRVEDGADSRIIILMGLFSLVALFFYQRGLKKKDNSSQPPL